MSENLPATQRQRSIVESAVPIYDSSKFEHYQRIATVMARASLMPAHLRSGTFEETIANCFMIVNQADRWGMDPFAVAQSCFVLHGKLGYEGKLVTAMIEAKIGQSLDFEWNDAEPGSDKFGITVRGARPTDGKIVEISGTVGDWKTFEKDGKVKGNWRGLASRNQLAYRGSREWARLYASGLMLGVYTPDEMDELDEEFRVRQARDITPPEPGDEEEAKPKRARQQKPAANKYADEQKQDDQKQAAADAGEKVTDDGEVIDHKAEETKPAETKPEETAKPKEDAKPAAEKEAAKPKPESKPRADAKPKPAEKVAEKPAPKTMGDIVPGYADIPGDTRKLIQAMHDDMNTATDIEQLKDQWNKHFRADLAQKPWPIKHDDDFRRVRDYHKGRIFDLEKAAAKKADDFDTPPDPGADAGAGDVNPPNPDDQQEANRDIEQFKADLKAELETCKTAEQVQAKFSEWTELAVRSGEFTPEQVAAELQPLAIEAASRFT